MIAKPESALLIVGHGSTVNPDSSAPTYAHANALRKRGQFGEVVCAFWKEEPSLRDVLHMVVSEEVYVVPNFISEGYFTQKIIPRELGLTGALTRRGSRAIKYCEPTGSHSHMTNLLLRRAREIAPGVSPAEATLLIIGHGTSLNENSGIAVKEQIKKIRALNLYAEAFGVFMEEEPLVTDWRKIANQPNVVVVPFFISDGLHSYQDIPVLLGIESEPIAAAASQMQTRPAQPTKIARIFRENPHRIGDRALYYANAIGTEPLIADVILEQAAAFDTQHPEWK